MFIPAKQRARTSVHLEAPYAYYGEKLEDGATPDATKKYRERLTAFVQTELVNLGKFTLFDHARRYQIDFPDGWKKK